MTTVVCDASPLIFLAKVDRLGLIREILGERIVVLQCVADEVESEQADPVEAARLSGR
jgi:predicted nucleic acid-binding protein